LYTLKVITVRLFWRLKIRKNGRKQEKKGSWAVVPTPNTDSEARYRHRLQVRKANNSSLWKLKACNTCSKEAGCPAPERTIVQSEAEFPARVQLRARRQSEQSQKSATFFRPGVNSTGQTRANNHSLLRPAGGKNEQ
jgi:hypothetical protein